jgi:HD superfamily phosphohydrolase
MYAAQLQRSKDVAIYELERTPQFLRLKEVEQLGLKPYIMPDEIKPFSRASHLYLTEALTKTVTKVLVEKGLLDAEISGKLEIAAFLHDIGHAPFSHVLEDLLEEYTGMDHRKRGKELIIHSYIAEVLEKHGYSPREISKLTRHPIISQPPFGTDKLAYLAADTGNILPVPKEIKNGIICAIKKFVKCCSYNGKLYAEGENGKEIEEKLAQVYEYMWENWYTNEKFIPAQLAFNKLLEKKIRSGEIDPWEIWDMTDMQLVRNLGKKPEKFFAELRKYCENDIGVL